MAMISSTPLGRLIATNRIIAKDKNGKKIPYATPPGPSELIGTPVLYKEKSTVQSDRIPSMGMGGA